MKADILIQELQGELPIAALDEFNTALEESSDPQGMIHSLLLTSRRCEDILNLLEDEKRTSTELATIFTSLGHILLNIAGELTEYSHVGLHITKQLLHNYETIIYKLVGPSCGNRSSKSALRCLTGMVMIGEQAANEVLTSVDWEKINIHAIANRQSVKDVYDVRAWCIYLILAFMNSSEEPYLTQQFLLKKDLLPAIFPCLVWDPCERVINVLKVMHESVLLNPRLTKTMKLGIFTPTSTKYLLDLYHWMGPVGKLAKGGNLETLESDLAKEIREERAQVIETLHKFLLTLCTSTVHGIIFKEKFVGELMKSNNMLGYNIMSNLKTPWDSPEKSELVSTFLGKCPDLLRNYLASVKHLLKARSTESFASLLNLITRIIDNQKPWMKLNTHGTPGLVSCIIPYPLSHAYIKSILESSCGSVRLSGIKLVFSVLSKTKETIEMLKNSTEFSQEVKFLTQKKMLKMIFKVVMSDSIICCWEIASGQATMETNENQLCSDKVLDHKISELVNIARVLTLYNELHPKEPMYEALDPLKMLDVIQTLPEYHSDNSERSKLKLELQVLCLELLAHSKQSLEIVFDSSATECDYSEQIKENILYKLITIYTQSGKATITKEDEELKVLLSNKCFGILSNALARVGLPAHYDGNVRIWLKNISDEKEAKLASFLTRIIQQAVSSLHHYTDAIIKASISLKEDLNEGLVSPCMNSIETTGMEDTQEQEVSTLSLSLPFSRLVFAAIDLIQEELDPDYVEYFSKVISNYQYSVNDPELLTAFLLQNDKVLTPALVEYLRASCRESMDMQQPSGTLEENSSLSEILKYLFMTNDMSSVGHLLEYDRLQEILSIEELDLVISQLLLYIHLKSSSKKNKKVQRKYVSVLKNIYLYLESSDPPNARHTLQTVLEHPRMLTAYQPFSLKNCVVTELAMYFIESVLQKHPGLVLKLVPYFDNTMKALEVHLSRNESVNSQDPLSPFLVSEHTIVSYEAAEQLLIICLKAPHPTLDTVENILIGVVKLISKTTSAKRKLKEETVELLLSKFLECGKVKEVSTSQEALVHHLETLLIKVMNPATVEQLTKGDLKSLLQFPSPCPDLCCHIVKQHAHHGHTLVKHLKKHGTLLPRQAPLLAQLLNQSDTQEIATEALIKVMNEIEMWVMDFEGAEDEISLLLPHVLNLGLLDEHTVTNVCHKLYQETVINKQLPPKKLMSLLPMYRILSKGGHTGPSGDLPRQHLSILHICLSCIKTSYQKENRKLDFLLSIIQLINEVIPKLDECSLKKSLINNKLWASFVKQVLRVGITDPELGPDMVQILSQLSSVLYKKTGNLKDVEESVLPINIFYQMIIGHSQYLTLMFTEEEEWERLKEKMVALQQTLVDCEETICQENHVPIFLGAYGASMSLLDQRLLKLLFTYEREGFMTSYQPILWGKAAIEHYGVKSQNVGFFKDPMPDQVLGLLNMDKILHTCFNFDTRLPFEPTDVFKENKEVYDVRFLLPLVLYLAEEERLNEIDYADSGAVALGLVALTSHHRQVQGIGAAILRFLVDKMEKSSHTRLSLPWVWLVGVISCALNGKHRRLPALTTNFLIQASHLLSQPDHPMYHIVLNYVYLKPEFKLYSVPELYKLYNSADITDSRNHRSFLLSILSSGIRQIVDYSISQRDFTATLMMGMLQSPSSDAELKVQVFEVLEAMVRIPLGATELVCQYSLLTVLSAVFSDDSYDLPSSKSSHLLLTSAVVRVLVALWKTLFTSTTRKDIIASDGPEKCLPVENDNQTKRKGSPEVSESSHKRIKVNSDLVNSHSEKIVSSKDSSDPAQKLLPPLFIHEFFNTLMHILPATIANCSPITLSTYIELVSDVVQYIEKINELSSKKQKIRLAALAPEILKQQVFNRVPWKILRDYLQEYLSDDEEVKLLGDKSKDFFKKWRSEPLSVPLQKVQPDAENSHGILKLKKASLNLLNALRR